MLGLRIAPHRDLIGRNGAVLEHALLKFRYGHPAQA